MDMYHLYLLVPIAPLAGAVVVGLIGSKLGRVVSHWLCIAIATPAMQSQCETVRPSFGPKRPTMTAPASGASGTRR